MTTPAEKFAHASKMIAQSLGSEVDQQIMKFVHTVAIDGSSQFQMYPSNVEHFPLGLIIQAFDRTGGLDSETAVGLFADHSFVLACIQGVLAIHNQPAETVTEHLVMHDEVQVGDLFTDLGFTVDRKMTGPLGTWVWDGDRMLYLDSGYEIKVVRNWDGYSSFMAVQEQQEEDASGESDLDTCIAAWRREDALRLTGSETAAHNVRGIAKDIFKLAVEADIRIAEYGTITDDEAQRLFEDSSR